VGGKVEASIPRSAPTTGGTSTRWNRMSLVWLTSARVACPHPERVARAVTSSGSALSEPRDERSVDARDAGRLRVETPWWAALPVALPLTLVTSERLVRMNPSRSGISPDASPS
jgi:hypothetical protein